MFLKIDAERVIDCLREARQKLNNAEGETVLDLSSVRRIDPSLWRRGRERYSLQFSRRQTNGRDGTSFLTAHYAEASAPSWRIEGRTMRKGAAKMRLRAV